MLKQAMTPDEIVEYLTGLGFGYQFDKGRIEITASALRRLSVRFEVPEKGLRPGETVNGPVQFMLADSAFYYAIIGTLGPMVMAVTSNLNINFLRRPKGRVLLADCRLLKVGRTLVSGDIMIYIEGDDEPVAHATGTYALPRSTA